MDRPQGLDPVTAVMAGMGFRLVGSGSGTIDSGAARHGDGVTKVLVWTDRSQWFIDDERAGLEPMGFFRAFDDVTEFCDALDGYVNLRGVG